MKRLCAAAAVVTALAAASTWGRGPLIWTNPAVPAPEVLDRLNLKVGWRLGLPVEGFREGIATIQNLGDVIIVQTTRGAITALDPVTGAARWRTAVGLQFPINLRVGYNDSLILVPNGTRIFALDRATGKELWDVDLPGSPSSPPTANTDAFFICLANGRLSAYAFPVETAPAPGATGTNANGKPTTPAAAPSAAADAARTPPIRPTAANTRPTDMAKAPAGTGGRTVTVSGGIDTRTATTAVQVAGGRTAATGQELNRAGRGLAHTGGPHLLWDYQTNLRISERPVLSEKHLFVASTGRDALFMDKTGARPLVFTADADFSAPLAQYGDIAYAACANGSIYAFDLPSRVTLWQATANSPIVERPVATDDDLFVTSERGGVARFNRVNGEFSWQNPAAVRFVASNPKFVYARDGIGRLLVLDRIRGTTLTTLDIRDFTINLANGETDRLILAANDGTIVSLHDRGYPQPLHLRNPPPPLAPVASTVPSTPEAKPETPPETPATPPVPPTPKPPPATPKPPTPKPPPASPPATPPVTPPATPPVTPPPANPPAAPPDGE